MEEKCNFQGLFAQFGAFFVPGATDKKSDAISLQKIEGRWRAPDTVTAHSIMAHILWIFWLSPSIIQTVSIK